MRVGYRNITTTLFGGVFVLAFQNSMILCNLILPGLILWNVFILFVNCVRYSFHKIKLNFDILEPRDFFHKDSSCLFISPVTSVMCHVSSVKYTGFRYVYIGSMSLTSRKWMYLYYLIQFDTLVIVYLCTLNW